MSREGAYLLPETPLKFVSVLELETFTETIRASVFSPQKSVYDDPIVFTIIFFYGFPVKSRLFPIRLGLCIQTLELNVD